MSDLAFERELRGFLESLAPAEVPATLTGAVHNLAANDSTKWAGRFERIGGRLVAAVAVLLVAAIGTAAVLNTTRPPATIQPGAVPPPVSWETQMAELSAREVAIEVGGKSFLMPADVDYVSSDPGSSTYRTLELGWSDEATEMRLSMYFAADAASWWVSHIRTYDGREPGDWIYYPGVGMFRSPLGQSYTGDVNLFGVGMGGFGRLRIEDMTLTAFEPGTVPPAFDECRFVGGDGDLSGFGIAAGMEATEVGRILSAQNVCHRFVVQFTALNEGQIWCTPPPGKVREFLLGVSGEIHVFIEDRSPYAVGTRLPQVVGC